MTVLGKGQADQATEQAVGKTTARPTRRGARAAKRALRGGPLAEEDRAVRPGLSGGRFQPLNDLDIHKINEAVMTALSTVASAFSPIAG